MKNLQERYRILATNASADDLIEMAKIRGSIRELLFEKTMTNYRGYRERSAQTSGELAQARLSSTRSNQSVIQCLNHPLKGRVDKIDEMFDGLPKLSVEDSTWLDRDITVAECFDALRSMLDRRTPADGGIPAEVWRSIFPLFGNKYVHLINVAKGRGHFQLDFLRALLTLIKKENAADGLMKNFRALSLINIGYKII